ncbi:MAG: PKD domain-containing protein, partial [Gammaproteobacteria bacterium]
MSYRFKTRPLGLLSLFFLFITYHPLLYAGEIIISDAKYEDRRLIVKGEIKGEILGSIKLYDAISGALLSDRNRSEDPSHFSFRVGELDPVPCRVRVAAGSLSATQSVEHAPADCSAPPPPQNQPPICSITDPANDGTQIAVGGTIYFAGTAQDPEGGPLNFEWDFNGGADVRPSVAVPGDIRFDTAGGFSVNFIVTDAQGARCTDTVTVTVGDIPSDLPPMVSQQPAPGTVEAGDGRHVVLPANDLGMHCADLGSYPFNILPPFNTVNAHALLKGSTGANRPRLLDGNAVTLQYSAASNPNDPVAPDSINSTSRNFPVGSKLADATIAKSDFWDEFGGRDFFDFDWSRFKALADWYPCPTHDENISSEYDMNTFYWRAVMHCNSMTQQNPYLDEMSQEDPYVYAIQMHK